MLSSRKGQAILELAILGSLIIMAFSIVISLSENYNRQQSYMQQTFRSTLYKAQDINDSGSVSTVDFRRMPNVASPMEIGQLNEFNSGNSVLWSDGKKKGGAFTQSKQFFLHNRGAYEEVASGTSGTIPGSTTVSSSGYQTNLGADGSFDKGQVGGSINTQKDLNAQDTIGGWATVGDKTVGTGGALGTGGNYGFDGAGVVRHTNNTKE
ncbi:MAG TPA: hypothetical protein PL125_07230 [Candidatus Omnitrophota bacterium]|nr:hypothetical protein [Candidatus Omnitrophota bacterium]HPT39966.1 hypothetical protein [Candidatus Omnitrophota bacterium]